MATYQSNTSGYAGQGGNSMFQQLNAATQRMQEARQAKRSSDWYAKQDATNLGKISDDFYDSYADNENIQLGDTKNWRQHYQDLTGGDMKEMRKIHGEMGTPENLKAHFQKKTAERDLSIMNAIKRKMDEMGTNDLHKVVPKFNEEGGKEFREWYNNASDEVRTELRIEYDYQPGQEEKAWVPDWVERRQAQGKSTGMYVGPAALGTAYAAHQYGTPMVKKAMRPTVSSGRTLMKAELAKTSQPAKAKIQGRIAKYKADLKLHPGSKKTARNLARYEKYLTTLERTGKVPYRMGGVSQMEDARGVVKGQLRKQAGKGLLGKVGGVARMGVGYYGAGQIGSKVEQVLTGQDTGIGSMVSGLGLPATVKAAAKSKAGKSLINHVVKAMGKSILASQVIDAGVPTYVDLGAGLIGAGIGAYNWYKDS